MATLKTYIMANNVEQTNFQLILQFIKDCLPIVGGIIAAWKTIDEIAKWYSRKQEMQLRELIKAEVNPQIERLSESIDKLREEIGRLKIKI